MRWHVDLRNDFDPAVAGVLHKVPEVILGVHLLGRERAVSCQVRQGQYTESAATTTGHGVSSLSWLGDGPVIKEHWKGLGVGEM